MKLYFSPINAGKVQRELSHGQPAIECSREEFVELH